MVEETFKCERCNKEKKHYAKKKCKSCYAILNLNKEKHKERVKRWKLKNPNYFKDYYFKNKNKETSDE